MKAVVGRSSEACYGGRVGLCLCTLPAFTLVSLYQLDNALMKHDRTSFHSHVGANALKCERLHCFVARAGKENFKWPRSNVLFSCGTVGKTIIRKIPSRDTPQAQEWVIARWQMHYLKWKSTQNRSLCCATHLGEYSVCEYWISCEHKQSQQARVCNASKKHNRQLLYL